MTILLSSRYFLAEIVEDIINAELETAIFLENFIKDILVRDSRKGFN